MADDKCGGQVKKIRRWLQDNTQGEMRDLYAIFGGPEMTATLKAIEYLEERAEIFVESAKYSYGRKHGLEGRETKQTGIYSALRNLAKICRVVNFEEVIRIAEVDASYARRYLNFLAGLGYVERRFSGYAVLDKAMKQPRAPRYNQRQERFKTRPKPWEADK